MKKFIRCAKKFTLLIFTCCTGLTTLAQDGQRVFGTITDGYEAVEEIKIEVIGSDREVNTLFAENNLAYSNEKGFYEVLASPWTFWSLPAPLSTP